MTFWPSSPVCIWPFLREVREAGSILCDGAFLSQSDSNMASTLPELPLRCNAPVESGEHWSSTSLPRAEPIASHMCFETGNVWSVHIAAFCCMGVVVHGTNRASLQSTAAVPRHDECQPSPSPPAPLRLPRSRAGIPSEPPEPTSLYRPTLSIKVNQGKIQMAGWQLH
ncbi:hypothetical protein IQ07DRAFT_434805 [Pyrenochaeta sp. DS3sAY3a]|nr:hypothetical protein IQ07DRAFT_434805 [Pyrenochaeta sp. DS3sAY3a]